MKLKKYIILCLITSLTGGLSAQKTMTGIEVLKKDNFKILEGKRVGLITNPTGVDNSLKSTIDSLFEAPNVNLVALYGPEHGVRGDVHAGDKVENSTDPSTGLPVYSLYGKTRKPTPEMLQGIDVLVYDIQDIGCRSFTYISTMGVARPTQPHRRRESGRESRGRRLHLFRKPIQNTIHLRTYLRRACPNVGGRTHACQRLQTYSRPHEALETKHGLY